MIKTIVKRKSPVAVLLKKMASGVILSSVVLHGVSVVQDTSHDKLFPKQQEVKQQEKYIPKIRKIKTVKPVMKVKSVKKVVAVAKPAQVKKAPRIHSKSVSDVASKMVVQATAYTANCTGCSGITATGLDVRNHTPNIIAVDPSVVPLHSKVRLSVGGQSLGVYTASDTGGAIKGLRIDVLVSSYDKAISFGRKAVTLEVLK